MAPLLKFTLASILVLVLALAGTGLSLAALEKPRFSVAQEFDGWEIRDYEPRLEARVTVQADSLQQAGSLGFRVLANFIFGGNVPSESISMTSPVTTRESTKIAMTAPVSTERDEEGRWTIAFTMPSEYSLETLPRPLDDRVQIVQVSGGRWAAARFNGRASDRHAAKTAELDASLRGAGFLPVGPAVVAQYNPPSVPPPMRRNEVLLPIAR